MNNQNKPKSEQEAAANKILYITVAAMLIIMATVVVLSSVLSRAKPAVDTDTTVTTATSPTDASPTVTEPTPSVTLPTIADTEPVEDVITPEPDNSSIPTLASPVSSGYLSKEYSDKVLVYSTTMEDYRTHLGIDINAKLGAPVLAAADGKIADIWHDAMTGYCIKIEHAGGLVTIYRNLADTQAEGISKGSQVKRGDTIGYVGESSMVEIAQEPHLHFEAQIDGKHVDPKAHLSPEATARLTQDTTYEN